MKKAANTNDFSDDIKEKKEIFNSSNIEMQGIFPLVSGFLKTGRTYQCCYGIEFTDLLWLPLDHLDKIISIFPIEDQKLFENEALFRQLCLHSSRSVGQYYEKTFDKHSIWIPIPISICQRKIAKYYIRFFLNKVNNQHKKIVLSSDIDICFNSIRIISIIKSEAINKQKEKKFEKS